jgi:hypothetical protein
MRPTSIVQFERFYLGALVVGLVNNALNWSRTQAMLAADPNVAAAGAGFGSGFMMVTIVASLAISLLLWYFVAKRGSNIAKWIVTVLTGLGLISVLFSIGTMLSMGILATALGLVALGMQVYAVYMLFRPDAVAWLEGKGPTNTDIFN